MKKEERAVATQIARELRRLRKERGWSQLELAERADLSVNYVSLIERAERLPSMEVIIQLAEVLGTTLAGVLIEPTENAEPWLAEATAILRTLPVEARGLVVGMLRGASQASGTRSSAAPKRGRRSQSERVRPISK